MATAITRFAAGIASVTSALFRKSTLSTRSEELGGEGSGRSANSGFASYGVRRTRYALYSALYENAAYSADTNPSASMVRSEYRLSPRVRGIFNAFKRGVDFWGNHTYPGSNDPDAGDGKVRYSATPIETNDEDLRPVIAKLFDRSHWERNKTVFARLGAMHGDVGLYAVDDVQNATTYIEVIEAGSIVEYHADVVGACMAYAIEEWRDDPRPSTVARPAGSEPLRVVYREEGELVRDNAGKPVACRFRTYLGKGGKYEPYPWGTPESEWQEPYPFVPFVLVAHTRILPKCPFGHAEMHATVVKIFEMDDVASRFHDFIGKSVDPIWLFAGVPQPTPGNEPKVTTGTDDLPSLYAGPEARAQALIAALNLADVDAHQDRLKEEIKEDHPELRKDIESAVGDASGVALRATQQRVTTKAQTIRSGYDAGLKAVISYCVRIGGVRGYTDHEGYDPASLAADPGKLQFRIGDRPVFRQAKIDELAVEEKTAAIAESWDRAGMPLPAFLELQGWSPERIAVVVRERDRALAAGLPVGRAKQASPNGPAAAEAIQAPGGAAP